MPLDTRRDHRERTLGGAPEAVLEAGGVVGVGMGASVVLEPLDEFVGSARGDLEEPGQDRAAHGRGFKSGGMAVQYLDHELLVPRAQGFTDSSALGFLLRHWL